MVQLLEGFPYWEVAFDDDGRLVPPNAADQLVDAQRAESLTDLFVFSHGWNNSRSMARGMYAQWFAQLRQVLDQAGVAVRRPAKVGAMGVIWPSMRWADEEVPAASAAAGGAASLGSDEPTAPSDAELLAGLKAIFTAPRQQQALDEMARLLEARPDNEPALAEFQARMRDLALGRDAVDAPEDQGEQEGLLGQPPRAVFERMAAVAPIEAGGANTGGAAVFGVDLGFGTLWSGAKQALRQLTYFEMKKRAGVVGKEGLGPLLGRLNAARPDLRIHLVGHSFGARVISFALSGLPPGVSPVKSIFLLQGAFSHFAFARSLPHDPRRGGALAGLADRVDGPLLVSYSVHDTAVGSLYPAASWATGQDAAGLDDILFRWAAMGHDGAQAVNAAVSTFKNVGEAYALEDSAFLNLNGNELIRKGEGLAGAHGDIIYPQIAWAALSAAKLVG